MRRAALSLLWYFCPMKIRPIVAALLGCVALACSAPESHPPQKVIGPGPIMGGFGGHAADGGSEALPATCDDGNDCTADEPVGSACVFIPLDRGTPCIGGECVGGMCCDPGSCSFFTVTDAGAASRHCVAKCPPPMTCGAAGTCD